MEAQSRGAAAAVIVLVALVLAAVNLGLFVHATQGGVASMAALSAAAQQCAGCLAWLAGAPLIAGFALAFWVARKPDAETPRAAAQAPAPSRPSSDAALRLLALLQQEGRLIDFLEEDIGAYDDAQVGAAVRSIHEGCRTVLRERLTLERVIDQDDGASVEVAAGFDPAAIRVTGNVTGSPPFRGTLQHAGWRAAKLSLPDPPTDPTIIAPAEVEVS